MLDDVRFQVPQTARGGGARRSRSQERNDFTRLGTVLPITLDHRA